MLNLPDWGRGNFHAVEHWLAHLFDHHTAPEPAPRPRRSSGKISTVRKRHPLEVTNGED